MIGLDTNVIIRYLVQDDPIQSQQANRIIEKAIADGKTLRICHVTLCEVTWVLERCYDLKKSELIDILRRLLHTQQIQIENEAIAKDALLDFESHIGVDFSDCLIGRNNASYGCPFTYTFDKKAAQNLRTTFKFVS